MFFFFFFNDTATTEIYTLSLHDALPISANTDRRCVLLQNRSALGGNVRPAWQDLHRSIVQRPYPLSDIRGSRISALFGRFRKKAVFEGLLRLPGASGPAAQRPCSNRSVRRRVVGLGRGPRLPPTHPEGQSSAVAHTSSRENAFFLLNFGWVKPVYGLLHVVTRSFLKIFRPDHRGERAAHFAGNICWYLVMSTDCQSPLMMPARIYAAVLPFLECS